MPNFPFVIGDSLQIGSATISATGNAIVLPTGTSVGGTQVATTQEVATGGGPKITNLQITDVSWAVLDDTAVDTAGGYVLITGTNFVSGALVYFNQTPATSVAFVSTTSLRVTVPALTAGTYVVYVINPDGGTAIRVPGLTASANPAWQTASALPEQYDGVAITLNLVATDATSYTLVSGSLPPGLSLNANTGVITGTVTGVTVDTTYTFTVRATDAQLQDSPRTFTVTITVSDPYFRLTSLLLSGSAVSANTVVRDSSTNNFNLTVFGDARASNFTPYGTGWSVYFDGTGDYLSAENSATFAPGSGDFTAECWIYSSSATVTSSLIMGHITSGGVANTNWAIYKDLPSAGNIGFYASDGTTYQISGLGGGSVNDSRWHHIAVTRSGSSFRVFVDGTQVGSTGTWAGTIASGAYPFKIGYNGSSDYFNGYISNLRMVKGGALYTTSYTPPTQPLTAITNTSLLTCHANRFLDGSTNNFTVTRNGDAKVVSFNPFNITNTGVNGSMYFDGTGDYLSTASNAALGIGSGNFTIEFWINFSSVSSYPVLFDFRSAQPQAAPTIYLNNDSRFNYLFNSGTAVAFGPNPLIVGTWYHVAWVRSGTTHTIYVNGQSQTTFSDAAGVASSALIIGARQAVSVQDYFNGYISDFRFVKGTAVYTANFTPPTQPLTAIANTQLLTLQYDQPHNNHTFLDSSSNQFLITRSGNATQGTFSPFSPSGWSNYFVANNANTVTAATAAGVAFGTGDFCQEFFLYATSYTGTWRIISYASVSGTASLLISSGAVLGADTGVGGLNTGITLPTNTWFHLAYTRQSGRVRVFVNGVLQYNFADTTNYSTSQSVYIGGYPGYTQSWDGYISNARIIKGSVPAAYQTSSTTNGTSVFTPPTGPLTAVTGTELLTCQSSRFVDNNTQTTAKTITLTSSPQVQAFSPFAPTAVYNPVSHGGSGYVDGSGDYFILTNESAYDFGDGNFSIDFWYYPLSAQGYGGIYMRDGQDYPLGIYSGTSITPAWPECSMAVGTTTTWFATGINTSGVQKYAWNHIAFTRVGNTFRAFTNGVLSSVVTASGTMGSGGTPWIGKNGTAAGQSELSMYLSGFRMTKGGIPTLFSTSSTTTGTTIFAVPTQPFTANDSLTGGSLSILANFADAAILDSTGRTVIETVADAKSSSVITKFTGGSMYFDGTGDALRFIQSPHWNITSTTTHTIEAWVYHTGTTTKAICANYWYQDGSVESGWLFQILATSSVLRFYSAATSSVAASTTAVPTGAWVHVAAIIVNLNVTFYINGVNAGGGGTVSPTTYNNTVPSVGAVYVNGGLNANQFIGYINDLRITQGYARYTANFTAPTAPARLK